MKGQCLPPVALAVACLAVTQACDGSSTAERTLGHADAEVFEVVARAQRAFGTEDSSQAPRFLRIDSRPIDNITLVPAQASLPAGLDPDDDSAQLSSRAVERIARERRAILDRIGVEEGGPFVFPGCGGVRTGEPPPELGDPSTPSCPTEWRRYVTIGLPRRGVAQIPEKFRRTEPQSFDTTEVWTVLVTESSIGVGGQDWKQYAWVLTRQPGFADLTLVARFLLSRAE